MKLSPKKLLLIAGLAFAWFLGCNSNNPPSNSAGKSETDRVVETVEQESVDKPVATEPVANVGASNAGVDRNLEKYLLSKYREGVTPENNAAVLFWQAIWPGDFLEPEDYDVVCHELGLSPVPQANSGLKSLFEKPSQQRVLEWLRANGQPNATEDTALEFTDRALRAPWTGDSAPPLADWLRENQKQLDLLVEATKRPRFYSPSPSLLNDVDESIVEMLTPGPQMARHAGKNLAVRAMGSLGEGHIDDAWLDVLAIYRLGHLVSQGHLVVEQLVGFALDLYAKEATLAILEYGNLSLEQAKRTQLDLSSLAEYSAISEAFDVGERISLEDITKRVELGKKAYLLEQLGVGKSLLAITRVPADWNLVRERNEDFYDRVVAVARMPPGPERAQAVDALNREIAQIEADVKRKLPSILGMTEAQRGEVFSSLLLALQLANFDNALLVQDRTNTYLTLTRLAAALAVYRAEHGRYPDSLDALVPGIIERLPVDCFHKRPFVYRPNADGYILYSCGPNGQDDGGSSQQMNVFKGYSTELETSAQLSELLGDDLPLVEDETAAPSPDEPATRPLGADDSLDTHIPQEADDFSIRLPLPKLELPKAK